MSASKWAYDPEICDGQPCPGDCDKCTRWQEPGDERVESMSDGIIRAKADNGFSGELKVGKYMAIYKNGREVLSISEPAPKTKTELEKVLESMTDFMDEYAGLMAQIKKATLKDAEVEEALMEDEVK